MTRFEGVEYGSKEYRRLHSQEWRRENPEKAREAKNNWRRANPDKDRILKQRSRHKNPIAPMLTAARWRAKIKGLEFSLVKEDIVIPEYCPVLGLKLEKGFVRQHNSPSLDRMDNSKGYTKDNIRVISLRANELKRDATVEEMEKLSPI